MKVGEKGFRDSVLQARWSTANAQEPLIKPPGGIKGLLQHQHPISQKSYCLLFTSYVVADEGL